MIVAQGYLGFSIDKPIPRTIFGINADLAAVELITRIEAIRDDDSVAGEPRCGGQGEQILGHVQTFIQFGIPKAGQDIDSIVAAAAKLLAPAKLRSPESA